MIKSTAIWILGWMSVAVAGAQSNPVRLSTAETIFGIVNPGPYGASPLVAAVGDFNNDGIPDVVTIDNGSPPAVALLLGHGDGTFASPVQVISLGSSPLTVVVADFNKDGNLDFAYLGSSSGTGVVGIELGNGAGGFTTGATYTLGNSGAPATNSAQALATADINHDGRPDLIALNDNDETVSVLIGKGDGTFRTPVTSSVTSGPTFTPLNVTTGDMNGDGRPDLVISGNGPNGSYVSVMLGNGNGTFQTPVLASSGYQGPWSYADGVAVGDLNGDGKKDVAVATAQGATVMLGNGDGTLQTAVNVMMPSRSYCYADMVALEDLNHDGKLDMVLTFAASEGGGTSDASTVAVFLGNGDGTFKPGVGYTTQAWPSSIAIADLNGDGALDLALGSTGSDYGMTVLLGNNDGTFQAGPSYGYSESFAQGFVAADFNGDGYPDVALARNDGTINVFAGTAHGALSPVPITSTIGNGAYVVGMSPAGGNSLTAGGMVAADLTGDGKPDIVATVDASGGGTPTSFVVLPGTGNGGFGTATFYSTGDSSGLTGPVVADLNGDGRPDVLIFNADGNVSVFLNSGNGVLGTPITTATSASSYTPLVGHFTSTSHLDALLYDCPGSGNAITVLPGDGTGHFGSPVASGAGLCANAALAADFNNDGKPDLAIGEYQSGGAVQILLGNGDGTFTAAGDPIAVSGHCANVGPYNLSAADLNGDGNLDLIVADAGTSDGSGFAQWPCGGNLGVVVFTGNGDGTLSQNVAGAPFLVGPNSGGVLTADFNRDGLPDVAVLNGEFPGCCGSSNTFFTVLLNQSAAISFSPGSLSYATQLVGTVSAAQGVVLTNNGATPLSLGALEVSGADAVDFQLTNHCPSSLAPGRNCSFTVKFAPEASGNPTAAVTGAGASSLPLSGAATQVKLSPAKLNFGPVAVGVSSTPKPVTLQNVGSTTLTFTGTRIKIVGADAGDYSGTNNCGASVSAGDSCTVTVTFSPKATGTRTAAIHFTDNGGASPQSVTLTGTGN
jgi:hypothetical protein